MNGVRISALFSGIEIKLAYLEARLYKLAHRRDWVSNYVNSEMNERTRGNFLNKTLSALVEYSVL